MINTVIYFFLLGSILYLGAPNISNKNPNIKNNLISNLIKSFLKINYIAKQLDFEAFP